MVLMHGPFQFGLSEREVALLLDALDAASVSPPEGSEFRASEFAELSAELAERAAY